MTLPRPILERWISDLEAMLRDADRAEMYLFGVHIEQALKELSRAIESGPGDFPEEWPDDIG